MGTFKNTLSEITTWLNGNGEINSTSFGDINELDLDKATNFPIAHIIPLGFSSGENLVAYNYQILFLDNKHTQDEVIDVLDRMATAAQQFVKAMSTGSLYGSNIQVTADQSTDIIYDQYQNRLYGWTISLTYNTPLELENCG